MSDQHNLSKGFLKNFHQFPDAKLCPYNPAVQILKGKMVKPNFYRAFITDGTKVGNSVISPIPLGPDGQPIENFLGYIIQMDAWGTKVSADKLYFYIKKAQVLGRAEPLSTDGLKLVTPEDATPKGNAQSASDSAQLQQQQHQENTFAPQPQAVSKPPAQKYTQFTPISDLSPYNSKWRIRVRVSNKSDVRSFKNGNGQLFNATFIDESGEIRVTGFTEAVTEFYAKLVPGNVYTVSNARVVAANKKFNPNQKYEITLDKSTVIEECSDNNDVPEIKADFVSFDKLGEIAHDSIIDVLGVVHSVSDLNEFTSKQGNNLVKRELSLVDSSGTSVRLTLWNQDAKSFDEKLNGTVVAAKEVKVSDFGGRSLSLTYNGQIIAQPNLPEAYKLQGWYVNNGKGQNFKNAGASEVSGDTGMNETRLLLSDVEEKKIGLEDTPDYFTTKALVSFISPNTVYYPACTTEGCNKKVIQETNGEWRCEKCDKTMPRPIFRYVLNMTINDFTGSIWVSAFNESGETILGITADELHDISTEDESLREEIMNNRTRQDLVFKIRSKSETYQNTLRTRHQVIKVGRLNYSEELKKTAALIDQYN